MDFDYERDTRGFYQDGATAQRYHQMYAASRGWRDLPSRVIAGRERRLMASMLARVPHRTALDIPTGTGKLAGVFAAAGTRVVGVDVSASMLQRAEAEFARAGHREAAFVVADAADLGDIEDHAFDVVVCLRLMHRVPPELRQRMLAEFARVGRHAIVSFGIENDFHRLRRRARATLFGNQGSSWCFCSVAQALAELEPCFEVRERAWIAPALSQEMFFLLRSKRAPDGHAARPAAPMAM